MNPGYVYIIKDIELTGQSKIGHTSTPGRRIYEFGVQLPFQTMVVMLVRSDNCLRLESLLHSIFSDKRTNGEWFTLTELEHNYARLMYEYAHALGVF